MGSRNEHLRRSRSWKDLSIFMSKKVFRSDDQQSTTPTPTTTPRNLHRTSSLGRGKLTKSRMFHDFDIDNLPNSIPSPSEQRAKELAFQRRASTTKRKLVPTPPPPPPPAQLPGFAFTPQVLHTPTQHVKNRSVSTAGHSRMASEMSVPMVLDFDLERHQDPAGLDFGFDESGVQKELSEEEKADLVHNAQPMHVVSLQRFGSKSSKTGTLKRLFSLRRNEKSHSRQSSTSKSKTHSPKRSESRSPPQQTIPNFEASNAKTIYTRPPQIHQRPLSPPPSPTSSSSSAVRRDIPPKLTVQIPDSTMDRASKIFQSIYAAHAHAQQELGSQFGLDTPQSASPSPPRQVLKNLAIPPKTSLDVFPKTFNATPRPAPRPYVGIGLLPAAQISKSRVQSVASSTSTGLESVTMTSQAASPSSDKRPQSTHTRLTKRGSRGRTESPEVRLSKRYSRIVVTAKGKMLTFPSPPDEKRKSRVRDGFVDLDTDEEDFESDEEWDVETIDSYTGKLVVSMKEPAWEMLTPPTRVATS